MLCDTTQDHCIEYTKKLEAGRKFTLCVWPEHCLVRERTYYAGGSIFESTLFYLEGPLARDLFGTFTAGE